ncbi:spore germination protein GerPC [Thalassobacillus hwangdonensis]|uniref:Spore germination protein GerPC n=1 Tax=Thalassobacillus hwangdonensis TaxID=546108 RepID=A0ABW3KZP8_9BACI
MYDYNSWQAYMQQLMEQLTQQQQEIKELYKKIDSLEKSHSEQPKTVIEKIEYKFDQLKIETLEGTLHIGLSPSELQGIEDTTLWNQLPNNPVEKPMNQTILEELDQYMLRDGKALIRSLAENNQTELRQGLDDQIIQDIRGQLPSRIGHYEQMSPKPEAADTIQRIKQEINDSISKFFHDKKGDDQR